MEPILLVDGNRGIYAYQQLCRNASNELKEAIIKAIGVNDFGILLNSEPYSSDEYDWIVEELLNADIELNGETYMIYCNDGDLWLMTDEQLTNSEF